MQDNKGNTYPFTPVFTTGTLSYAVSITDSTAVPYSISLTLSDSTASIFSFTENKVVVTSKTRVYTLSALIYQDPISITVIAQDGLTIQTYSIALKVVYKG